MVSAYQPCNNFDNVYLCCFFVKWAFTNNYNVPKYSWMLFDLLFKQAYKTKFGFTGFPSNGILSDITGKIQNEIKADFDAVNFLNFWKHVCYLPDYKTLFTVNCKRGIFYLFCSTVVEYFDTIPVTVLLLSPSLMRLIFRWQLLQPRRKLHQTKKTTVRLGEGACASLRFVLCNTTLVRILFTNYPLLKFISSHKKKKENTGTCGWLCYLQPRGYIHGLTDLHHDRIIKNSNPSRRRLSSKTRWEHCSLHYTHTMFAASPVEERTGWWLLRAPVRASNTSSWRGLKKRQSSWFLIKTLCRCEPVQRMGPVQSV